MLCCVVLCVCVCDNIHPGLHLQGRLRRASQVGNIYHCPCTTATSQLQYYTRRAAGFEQASSTADDHGPPSSTQRELSSKPKISDMSAHTMTYAPVTPVSHRESLQSQQPAAIKSPASTGRRASNSSSFYSSLSITPPMTNTTSLRQTWTPTREKKTVKKR